jgi:hypothetical protein
VINYEEFGKIKLDIKKPPAQVTDGKGKGLTGEGSPRRSLENMVPVN